MRHTYSGELQSPPGAGCLLAENLALSVQHLSNQSVTKITESKSSAGIVLGNLGVPKTKAASMFSPQVMNTAFSPAKWQPKKPPDFSLGTGGAAHPPKQARCGNPSIIRSLPPEIVKIGSSCQAFHSAANRVLDIPMKYTLLCVHG